jgi:hypothetical protein
MILEVTGAAVAASKIKEDSLLGLMYKDLAQPSVQAIGKALGTVFEFGTTPLLLMKFGSDVAKLSFKKHIDAYENKINAIPEAEQIPVNPQIGVPILDKLTYTTNDEIADLFTNLLAAASSSETVNKAHPAFIHIIDSLSVDEAKILVELRGKDRIPCIDVNVYATDGAYGVLILNGTSLQFKTSLLFEDNISTYLDNLTSLGILSPQNTKTTDLAAYEELKKLYNCQEMRLQLQSAPNYKELVIVERHYLITAFGKLFINTCSV